MKKFALLTSLLATTSAGFAQSGSLDLSFDTDGIVQHDISGTGLDAVYGMAQQADGKVVFAGYAMDGTNANCFFARMKQDGSLDSTFSTDGIVLLDVGLGANDRIYDLAIQDDGMIVGVGTANDGSNDNLLVVRLTSTGDPDVFFAGSGIVKLDASLGGDDRGFGVAIQPDGKIVAVGLTDNGANNDWLVARFNTDGSPDTGFDVNGNISLDVNGYDDVLEGVDIAPDGKIVAVGAAYDATSANVLVIRLDSAGQPDNTFSGDGKFSADLELTTTDYAMDCDIYPDGSVIVSGYVTPGGNSNGMLLRLKDNGILDGTFGVSGKSTYDPSIGNTDRFSQVHLMNDGSIFAGGWTIQPGTDTDFLVVKTDNKGDLDVGFNGTGAGIYDAGSNVADNMRCMAFQSDGKIMVAGYSQSKSTIIRVNNDVPTAVQPSTMSSSGLAAWPVPFSDHLQVMLPQGLGAEGTWELLGMDGRVYASGDMTAAIAGSELSVDLQSAAITSGIYVFRVISNQQVWTAKLLCNKQ